MAATNSIETSPTSPEACGLEMKQSCDTVNIRRIHLVQKKSSAHKLFLLKQTVRSPTFSESSAFLRASESALKSSSTVSSCLRGLPPDTGRPRLRCLRFLREGNYDRVLLMRSKPDLEVRWQGPHRC
jgi:hypothetical protein